MTEPMFGIEPVMKIIGGFAGMVVLAVVAVVGSFIPCAGCFVSMLAGVGILACLALAILGVVEYTQQEKKPKKKLPAAKP